MIILMLLSCRRQGRFTYQTGQNITDQNIHNFLNNYRRRFTSALMKLNLQEKLQDPECREDIAYLMPYLSPNKAKDYLTKGKFEEKQMSEALSNK